MGSILSPPQRRHVVLFPFMSKGHTIPLLHLARLLHSRRLADVTIFTTPANRPFIDRFLSSSAITATVISLPFPQNIHPEIPAGVESTEGLPSVTHRLFHPFAIATKHMQRDFENALASLLPRVSFIISDSFLWWTLDVATKLGLTGLAFYGFNNYAMSVLKNIFELENNPEHSTTDESLSSLLTLPRFPWIKIMKQELDPSMEPISPEGMEFHTNVLNAVVNSFGLVTNSFYELEPVFVDYLNAEGVPKLWNVGSLCQLITNPNYSVKPDVDHDKPAWLAWLDEKHVEGTRVMYVAFGTQAVMSYEQVKEIATALENSNVSFLWVIRKVKIAKEGSLSSTDWWDQFEEKVRGRGKVVSDWVDQTKILNHESVEGFLTHCGWNSAMEAICAGVPMLTLPMLAEQPLNAKMIVEEVKVGLRVELTNKGEDGLVKADGIEKMVRKLMVEEEGEVVRKKVKELAVAARRAVEEGGSSWRTLQSLVDEACMRG